MELRDKIWTAIRVLRVFTYEEVAVIAETTKTAVSKYLLTLYKCGYIVQAGTKIDSGGQRKNHWRLVKNTGPLSPTVVTCFHDPNVGIVQAMTGEGQWIHPEALKTRGRRRTSNVA